jgi:hypothetical protein
MVGRGEFEGQTDNGFEVAAGLFFVHSADLAGDRNAYVPTCDASFQVPLQTWRVFRKALRFN